MDWLDSLIESINSFRNLYKVVLRCIDIDTRSVYELSPILGLTANSTRHRIRNPQLWQLSEIEQIAFHYQLSGGACVRLREALLLLGPCLDQLANDQRKQLEKICQLKMTSLVQRLNSSGLVYEIERLYLALTSLTA